MTAVLDPTTSHLTHERPSLEQTPGIPFARLVRVELRKMTDTRAGRWMLIAMAGISVIVVGAFLIWGPGDEMGFKDFLSLTMLPLLVLLPVVGIMAATAEWSQRTGLVTFTLEPRRGRVFTAKILAGVILGLVVVAASFVASALANVLGIVFRDAQADWDMPWKFVLGFVIGMILFVLQGLGFGFSFLNTPVAIVASILLPTVWSVAGAISKTLNDVGSWLDLNRTTEPLFEGTMTASQWAHLGTSSLLWIVLPLSIGAWRVLTREVK